MMSNQVLEHQGTGNKSRVMMSHETQVTRPESLWSLEARVSRHEVMCHESTEEGKNICICLSFSVEALSWRLLQCKGGHQAAHWGLQLWKGLMALLMTFPL